MSQRWHAYHITFFLYLFVACWKNIEIGPLILDLFLDLTWPCFRSVVVSRFRWFFYSLIFTSLSPLEWNCEFEVTHMKILNNIIYKNIIASRKLLEKQTLVELWPILWQHPPKHVWRVECNFSRRLFGHVGGAPRWENLAWKNILLLPNRIQCINPKLQDLTFRHFWAYSLSEFRPFPGVSPGRWVPSGRKKWTKCCSNISL